MSVILCTGGFDPVHSGHIAYLKAAKKEADFLVVGLNSDAWLTRKKGRPFMPLTEREAIIREFKFVDKVISYNDDDNTSIEAIRLVKKMYPHTEIIFANGGDRNSVNVPEMIPEFTEDPGIEFKFGIGGDFKANSSSWILKEWKEPKTERPWGYYRVLYDIPGVKVKELIVDPLKKLSMQRHFKRNELWFVADGNATLNVDTTDSTFTKHEILTIPREQWHQLCNYSQEKPLKIIEIQYGSECKEEDIERK